MADKLPEEMSKGELLVMLLHKGEANLANSTKLSNMQSRIKLLEQALEECRSALDSLETASPEMAPLHISRIRGAVEATQIATVE